jgi:hypothetical protein
VSFQSILTDRDAPSTHLEQYAEFGGHRGFYRDGWKAVTLHRPGTPFDEAEWQLYDVRTDPTELNDLADQEPERLRELADAWEHAAWANTVFPLGDGALLERTRRPEEAATLAVPVRLLPGTPKLERYRSAQLIDMRSFAIDIDVAYAEGDAGVLVAHGDQGGGYLVWIEDGSLRLAYNAYGDLLEADGGPLAPGGHWIRLAAEAAEAFRWHLALEVDGEQVAALDRVPMLVGMAPFSGIDVGVNRGGPVHWGVHERHRTFPYSGALESVTYVPGPPAPYPAARTQRVREVAEALLD